MMLEPLHLEDEQARERLRALGDRFSPGGEDCREAVAAIIEAVRQRGDQALVDYTRRFDDPEFGPDKLRVAEEEFAAAEAQADPELRQTLEFAARRIREFHQREVEDSWLLTRKDGCITGRLVRPVDSAGLYVPGGQGGGTPLVSSVLMNGIPAAIAGVARRVMVTPPGPGGRISPALLLAAREAGIHEVYRAGSAWAIAALALGTESIAPVDVVVGPGNQYVTEAKRQIMGRVRIDMIAGPSEVLILADADGDPRHIAADMLAQAEHDPQALAVLISIDAELARETAAELERQVALLSRREIARASLESRGLILVAPDLDAAIEAANGIAAEHLELALRDPWEVLPRIRHAGAVFLGPHTPEAAGDYTAGPNHVLPTMGTARTSSALGVETFMKHTSVIAYSRQGLEHDGPHILRLAALEGLEAHGRSVSLRLGRED